VKSRLDDRTKEDAMKEAGVIRTVLEEQQHMHAVTTQVYEVGVQEGIDDARFRGGCRLQLNKWKLSLVCLLQCFGEYEHHHSCCCGARKLHQNDINMRTALELLMGAGQGLLTLR
jgi:hypothetical protein